VTSAPQFRGTSPPPAAASARADARTRAVEPVDPRLVGRPEVERASFPDGVASPWVLDVVRSALVQDGYAVSDGELWPPEGRLLVQSRQLRRVLRPAAPA
jgi:hypothetical protein